VDVGASRLLHVAKGRQRASDADQERIFSLFELMLAPCIQEVHVHSVQACVFGVWGPYMVKLIGLWQRDGEIRPDNVLKNTARNPPSRKLSALVRD
jgi:hypothetical protein